MATPTDMTKYVQNEEQMPLAQLLSNQAIIKRFEMAAGQNAGSAMINIFNAAAQNPEIWQCSPMSVVNAALNAASMRLSISPALGQACILPFNKNKKIDGEWVTEKNAQLVVMLRGVKDMAMRTNKYRTLSAFAVYKGQTWVEDQMTELGHIEGNYTEKTAIGYGAYLELFTGYKATVYMTVDELLEHARKYSPTFDKKQNKFNDKSRWVTAFDEQARKTVLKRLIMNKGVISEDDRAALEHAEEAIDGGEISQMHDDDTITGEVTDAEPAQAEINPLEAAYLSAKEVRTKRGALVVDLPADQIAMLIEKYADTEPGRAAIAIKAYNDQQAARAAKLASELGFN